MMNTIERRAKEYIDSISNRNLLRSNVGGFVPQGRIVTKGTISKEANMFTKEGNVFTNFQRHPLYMEETIVNKGTVTMEGNIVTKVSNVGKWVSTTNAEDELIKANSTEQYFLYSFGDTSIDTGGFGFSNVEFRKKFDAVSANGYHQAEDEQCKATEAGHAISRGLKFL